MNNLEKKEERNKRIGWITSVAVQLGLLVLFYFLIAWKAPFPPIPEYGIELGFATSAGATSSTPPPEVTEEQVIEEEIQEEEQQPVEEVVETEVVQPEMESMEEEIVTNEIETPVKVEKAVTRPTETKPVEKPKEKIEEKKVEAKPKENLTEKTDSGEGQAEKAEEPVVDQRAIYGSQGTSEGSNEGSSLSLSGWVWDFKPKPDDTSAETGKIVYKIVVDGDGYLVKIDIVTSTVSPAVERKYRQAVQNLTFSKTADYKTASQSTGSITFIIKTK
jgi:periplasmic protein TonB